MKKVLFLLAAAAMMLVTGQNAKAQLYAGGSFGYSTTTLSNTNGASVSGSSYKLLPEAGYKLNDKMAVGGSIGLIRGYAALGSFDPGDLKGFLNMAMGAASDYSNLDRHVSCIRIAPYFRYILFNTRHIDLFVDAGLALGLVSISQKDDDTGLWQSIPGVTAFEIAARPGFAYNLDKNIAIVGHLGSLGFQSLSQKDTNIKATRLGLDMDTNNILIGFEYHF